MKRFTLIMMILMFISLPACSAGTVATSGNPAPAIQAQPLSNKEVSFSKDIMPIFKQYSDSHHSSNSGNVYSLETYQDVMKNVIPGNPEQSKLYQRLTGQGGPVMPPSGKLPDDLLQLVYDWIKQGAKNN